MSIYTTKAGDTLTSIATKYKSTVNQLKLLNPQIKDANKISVGQKINVPGVVKKAPTKKPPVKTAHLVIVAKAITKALDTYYWPHGMCDNFVANMFGHAHSGYGTAAQHWAATPAKYRHTSKTGIPQGAIVLYGGGSSGAGHATLALGGGKERSIDMDANGHYHPGEVHTVTRGNVLGWGTLHYLGWIDPFLQGKLIVKVS